MLDQQCASRVQEMIPYAAVYLVGGCVRDHFLGLEPKDFDLVVVGSSPEDMLARGFSVHGTEHATYVHKRDRKLRGLEFSLARIEKKVAVGNKGLDFHFESVTLEDDLLRRDLTINSMALPVGEKPRASNVIDPHGGLEDLKLKRLHHVSEAFAEDPLRVLRVARFLARYGRQNGWWVSTPTLQLCRQLVVTGEVAAISSGRIGIEVKKMLKEPHPEDFLTSLKECGALEVVLPELDLYGIPQPEKHHPEIDTGAHLEMALQQGVKLFYNSKGGIMDPVVMWGILVHDVGKKLTTEDVLPQHLGHEKAGVKVARKLAQRLQLPKEYEEFGVLASELHTSVHRALEMKPGRVVKVLLKLDKREMFHQNVSRLCSVAEADARGRQGLEDRLYPQAFFIMGAADAYAGVEERPALVEEIKETPQREKGKVGGKIRSCLYMDRATAIEAVRKEYKDQGGMG